MHVDTMTREKQELLDACWGPFYMRRCPSFYGYGAIHHARQGALCGAIPREYCVVCDANRGKRVICDANRGKRVVCDANRERMWRSAPQYRACNIPGQQAPTPPLWYVPIFLENRSILCSFKKKLIMGTLIFFIF